MGTQLKVEIEDIERREHLAEGEYNSECLRELHVEVASE